MARDYKHRVQSANYKKNRQQKHQPKMFWRWLLVLILIVAFITSLNLIRKMVPALVSGKQESVIKVPDDKSKEEVSTNPDSSNNSADKNAKSADENKEPSYDFYYILPKAETVIPDYEIKTRVREELVRKTKSAKYTMQAGSFRDAIEAEHHKAKLAQLGIEAHVEKAKVGNIIWYRVKAGPYENSSSVDTIRDLLQKNGIGVIITETGQ